MFRIEYVNHAQPLKQIRANTDFEMFFFKDFIIDLTSKGDCMLAVVTNLT
jgi:hypothetical protein